MAGMVRAQRIVWAAALALLLSAPACTLLPSEFNLSPLYRQRLADDGSVREVDVLWPLFYYRRSDDGAVDFRIRPFYRYVEPAEQPEGGPRYEHQFLVPFGRVARHGEEWMSRLFPLWWYRSRNNEKGERETDWYSLLLVWGGSGPNEGDDYFAFLPFYADIPGFLTYDRFRVQMFPLHMSLKKGDRESELWLWPLIGWGSNPDRTWYWHRALPFYAVAVQVDRYRRYALLWPLLTWGSENLDTDHPISRWFLFPLIGLTSGERASGWTFLWPLFEKLAIEDRLLKLNILYPLGRYFRDEATKVLQWWVFPFVAHTESPNRITWNFLWPFVWLRQYDDPEGIQHQLWVLPFFWHIRRDRTDGTVDDFVKVWPLFHRTSDHDGTGEWQVFSPWPYRHSSATGVEELYGWLWTLARARWRPEQSSFHLAAHLFTTEKHDESRRTSVPFLFNYVSDRDGAVLRLFQLIPIPLGGSRPSKADQEH